jgi:transcriptional regulator with XRE-family HTH domain
VAARGTRRPDTLKSALGHQLMLCRTTAGYATQAQFAGALGMSETPIAKAESGDRAPSGDLFAAWLLACEVTGQLALVLEDMHRLARMKDDLQAYQVASWEEIEEQARTLMYWEVTLVPGIAQTEDYARSLFMAWRHTPEKVEELAARRIARRNILTSPEAPDVVIVLWQRGLETLVGSAQTMADQLALLLELSELPNVYIHVLSSGVQAGMGMAGPVSLAGTDTGDAVLTEGPSESTVTMDVTHTRLAGAIFNSVRASARNEADSRVLIREEMKAWIAKAGGSQPTAAAPQATA